MRRILAATVAATMAAALAFGVARSQDTSFNRIITLGAGLTNQVGVCNTGLQTIGPAGGTISPQACAQAYSSGHTVATGDGVQLYLANGSSAITFILARANGATPAARTAPGSASPISRTTGSRCRRRFRLSRASLGSAAARRRSSRIPTSVRALTEAITGLWR